MHTLTQPLVDVIIPTRNRGALIDLTINSILRSHHSNFVLWIVDQSENDETKKVVEIHQIADDRVHYIHSDSRGSSRARNLGIAAGNAPYVLFTDDDCRIHPDWISSTLTEMNGISGAHWGVFCRVEDEEPFFNPQLAEGHVPVHQSLKLASKVNDQPQIFQHNRFNLGFGHGAAMGFRRDVLERLNGFDELLSNGAELRSWPERDIGYRILAAGGSIRYTPHAIVYHRDWRSWPKVRKSLKNYGFGTGAAVGKYIRCGDWQAAYLLIQWVADQGFRALVSGIFKWRSHQKMTAGLFQIIYPWVGLITSLRYAVDKSNGHYVLSLTENNLSEQPIYDVNPTNSQRPQKANS
ncbi:MAG: glycosyltransferase [Chloroflexota bacterium]